MTPPACRFENPGENHSSCAARVPARVLIAAVLFDRKSTARVAVQYPPRSPLQNGPHVTYPNPLLRYRLACIYIASEIDAVGNILNER
jgi:hypothetical protein